MRVLDQYSRSQVQSVTDAHLCELQQLPNFVSAEPGFPIVNGVILRERGKIIVGSSDAADKIRRPAEAGFNEGLSNPAQHPQQGHRVDGARVLVSSANRRRRQSRMMLRLALLRTTSRGQRECSYVMARLFWLKPTE